jgi:outer membrane lipoprotein-sorting protein
MSSAAFAIGMRSELRSRSRPTAWRRTAALVVIGLCGSAASGWSADNAREIVQEAQHRTDASSQRYEGLLQVFDAKGKVSDKRWTYDRIGAHGASKSVLRFTAPAEVKGVALLVVNHPDRASDQWMWTPAIERDRRIALQDRSTRFFGTDFSFEDLEERDVEQYEYTLRGEEVVDGAACWRIESTPRQSKSSQYSRSLVWIRRDNYTFARIENYAKDQLVRRLAYSDIQNVQGIWTARVLEMTDVRRGSRTRLTLDKLQYNLPLKDEEFTLQAIRRP